MRLITILFFVCGVSSFHQFNVLHAHKKVRASTLLNGREDAASREEDRRRKAELYEQEKAALRSKRQESEANQAQRVQARREAPANAAKTVVFDPRISPHLQGSAHRTVGVIVVDHGSKREAANAQLLEVVEALKKRSGRSIVEPAHMELASPSLKDAYDACVAQGASSVVCHPFFLSPGRHVTEDIPTLLAEAAAPYLPDVPYVLTLPLGASEMVPSLIEQSIATTLKYYPPSNASAPTSDLGFFGEVMRMAAAASSDVDADEASLVGADTPPHKQIFDFDPRISPNEQ